MGKVVKSVGKFIGKVAKAGLGLVGMLFSAPKQPKASANAATETRLNVTLVPEENRKIVFGETALATDLRFWETFGSKNERHVQVIAAAGHAIESFGNLYVDEIPVPLDPFNPLPGNKYYQSLIRYAVTKGVGGNTFGSGTRWTGAASLWGCAHFVLEWVYSQEKLPNGIPSRITQVGKGAKVYDPRRDSTRGGSGAHRADNPDTWEYSPLDTNGKPIGRNNALQMLTYQLGLFIRNRQTNALVLVGGKGVDPVDIDFDTFITAANYCEIYGWYSDCVLSTGDSHSTNEGILEAAAGGELADVGGRFCYFVAADDTANAVVYLDENDIVGGINWEPEPSISQQFNELPGTFVDPAALFQTRSLPLCYDDAYYAQDGYKKRGGEMKLSAVQDPVQGQKLLRIALNRSRFPGEFTAPFNLKGLKVQKNSLVRFGFSPFGWTNKLFRVIQQGIATEGGIQLVLREEDASIYQGGTVVTVPPPLASYGGDRSVEIPVTTLVTLATGISNGPSAVDAIQVSWDIPDQRVIHTEVQFRKTGDAAWQTGAPMRRDLNLTTIAPLLPTTGYDIRVRHVTIWNVPGPWLQVSRTTNAVTKNSAGQITYADGTLVEALKPAGPNANNTGANISAGFAGQGALATLSSLAFSSQYISGVPGNLLLLTGGEQLDNLQGAYAARRSWTFATGTESFAAANSTMAVSNGTLVLTATTADPYLQTPAVNLSGRQIRYIRVRVRPLSDAPISWQGTVYYTTANHGYTGTYRKSLPNPGWVKNQWRIIEFDMGNLTEGGTDWLDSTINNIRFDFADSKQDWEIDWIAIGDLALDPVALRNITDNANETALNVAAGFTGQGTLATQNAVTWATQVTGTGRPADFATKSQVYLQQAAPASPGVNDIWVKLNGSGAAIAVAAWNGSGWIDGGNVTAFYTAAGFTGQGPLATSQMTEAQVRNTLVPFGSNAQVNSDFIKGTFGFTTVNGTQNGFPVASGLNFSGYSGDRNVLFATIATGGAAYTSDKVADVIGTTASWFNGLPVADTLKFGMTVGVGDRVAWRCLAAQHRCVLDFYILIFDKAGTLLQGEFVNGARPYGGANGQRANFNEICGFADVTNPNAARATLLFRIRGNGEADPYIFVTEPMMTRVAAGQTAIPVYNPGPSDPLGDQTLTNTAAGFTGQGALATQNAVTWATQVTGVGRPADNATASRVYTQQATPTGQTINDIWVKLNGSGQAIAVAAWNGSAWVDGGNVTSFYTAAGIAGQGPLATSGLTEAQVSNALSPIGVNQAVDSDLIRGGFFRGNNFTNIPGVTQVTVVGTGPINFIDGLLTPPTAAAGVFDIYTQAPSTSPDDLRKFGTSVMPNDRLFISFLACYANAADGVNVGAFFFNEAGVYVSELGAAVGGRANVFANGDVSKMDRVGGFVTIPNNPAIKWALLYARVNKVAINSDGHSQIAQPFICKVPANQTAWPAYHSGPTDRRSDQTISNISLGITGQGPGATAGFDQVMNERNALGKNQIVNSKFVRGEYGWGRGGIAANRGLNMGGYFGVNNVAYVTVGGVLASGSAIGGFYNSPVQNVANYAIFAMPVRPGDRVFASALLGAHRCVGRIGVQWLNSDGSGFPSTEQYFGGRDQGGLNGDPNNFDRVGGFFTVPAGITWCFLSIAMVGNGGSDPYIFLTQGMLTIVAPGQTVWPAYNDGPSDPVSDRTNDNTAGGVIGQGPLTTVTFTGNTYADNAAAAAAGRPVGWSYWNSTTNSLAVVVPVSVAESGFTLSGTPTPVLSGLNSATQTITVSLTGPAPVGSVTYQWQQTGGDPCTLSSLNGSATTANIGKTTGGVANFRVYVSDNEQTKSRDYRIVFRSNV